MATAEAIVDLDVYSGPARAFRLDPPLFDPATGTTYDHVVVCKTLMGGPRVEVYGCADNGIAIRMVPLPGSFVMQHDVTLDDACGWALATAGGYDVVKMVPDPIPEPVLEPEPEIVEVEVIPDEPVETVDPSNP